MDQLLATVTELEPRRISRRMELVDALYLLALASSDELELAIGALEPYDVNRFAHIFAAVDDRDPSA